MKKINIILALLSVTTCAVAQTTTKALRIKSSSIELCNFNPQDFSVQDVVKSIDDSKYDNVLPNSFMYNKVKDIAYFVSYKENSSNPFSRSNEIIGLDAKDGRVQSYTTINGKVLGSVMLAREGAVGLFIARQNFNYYANNDEGVAFHIIEEGTGRSKAVINLGFLSLNTPSMPFYGKIKVNDRDANSVLTETGISSPVYNVDRNQVVFCAIDVVGIKRLYVIDVNSKEVISQHSVQESIIDMAYIPATKTFKAIYYQSTEYGAAIYAADLDPVAGRFTNVQFVAAQSYVSGNTIIDDGAIRYDQENHRLFVMKNTTSTEMSMIELDMQTNEIIDTKQKPRELIDFKFPYTADQSTPFTALNAIILYPNPALETIQVATYYNDLAQRIRIYDVSGKLVKDFLVESGKDINTLNVSNLEPGVYTVDIETERNNITKRFIKQ